VSKNFGASPCTRAGSSDDCTALMHRLDEVLITAHNRVTRKSKAGPINLPCLRDTYVARRISSTSEQ